MESNNPGSSSKHEPGDCQLTSTQLEALSLFRRLVNLITSDTKTDIQNLQEFRVIIRQLCEAAPETAQAVATAIQEARSSINSSLQQEQDAVQRNTHHAAKRGARKPVSRKDLSYRPPRSAKATKKEPSSTGDSSLPENSAIRANVSVGNSTAHGAQSSVLDANDLVLQDQNAGVDPETSTESVNAAQLKTLSHPDQQQRITQDCSVPDEVDTADRRGTVTEPSKDMKESIETSEATSCNRVENAQSGVLPRPSTPPTKANPAVVTPPKPTEGAPTPPPTEEIVRETIPTSLKSISSSPGSILGSSSPEAISWIDLVIEAVRVLHQFSKHPEAVPPGVHSRILQTHQNDNQQTIDAFNFDQWTDGSMWVRILEIGSTQNQKVTILNMIEYIGAWEWYDRQVEFAMTTIRTKKKKLVDRKGAATHVLNTMQSMRRETVPRGRWVGGVGRVAVEQESDAADLYSDGDTDITEAHRRSHRKRISVQLSRGQKLTKLVKALSLGILFSPKIWQVSEYTKMNEELLDIFIRSVQADPRRMKLLQILGPQLELLVNKGQPNLHAIYDALCQEKLVSQQELQELRVTFALDSDPMPKGSLDTAVRGLIRDVSSRVLGKRKFEDIDAVTVNKIPVSCDIFEKLRNGRWLNDDIINLAMNISDKPSFVKHGYSVPLDEVGKTRTTKPIEKPLAAWARRIDRLRKQARDIFGDTIHPVYFCPLNHNNNHFTLLEVNDREKVIRHYDSMADQTITEGRFTLTRVAQLVEEEFADLGYAYSEAPTPQQTDGWSCGIRVVWNFTRLSNGLPIGGWDAVLEPERMIMELVEGLRACVETNAMGKYTEDPSESSSDSENRSKKARNLSPPGHPQRKTSRKATNRDSR